MERPVNVFPPDTGAQADTGAAGSTTSRVNQMERQDTLDTRDENQNPPGYRGMERPAALDMTVQGGDTAKQKATKKQKATTKKSGAKKSTRKKTSEQQAARDTAGQAAQQGDTAGQQTEVQNPAGYRGMERPVNVFPADTGAHADSGAAGDATSRVNQMQRQDTLGNQNQNPPGYRGMERPSSASQDTAGDATRTEVNARQGDTTTTTGNNRSDSVDVIHQQRQVPPGVDRAPPPYPADSERVWVEQQPSNDSVNVNGD